MSQISDIIRSKLLLWSLGSGLIIILVFSFLRVQDYQEGLKHDNALLTKSLTIRADSYVKHALLALENKGHIFKKLYQRKDTLLAKSLAEFDLHFDRMVLMNNEGKILVSEPVGLAGTDFPVFVREGEEQMISSPVVSHVTNKLVLFISHKLDEEFWIAGELDLSILAEEIGLLTQDENLKIILTDQFGNLIVHPRVKLLYERFNIGRTELFSLAHSSKESDFIYEEDQLAFASHMLMPDQHWHFFVVRDARAVIGDILKDTALFAGVLLFLLIAIILLTRFYLNVLIVKPIVQFIELVRSYNENKNAFENIPFTFAELDELKRELILMSREINRREEELVYSRELAETALQVRSEFISNISHEIRTPLNIIQGNAEKLKSFIGKDESKLYPVKTIQSSAQHLLKIMNNILDQSKMDLDQFNMKVEPVDIYDVFKHILLSYKSVCFEKGLNLRYEENKEFPGLIWIDHVRLNQILINLVDNAIKFTEQGEVLIEADWLQESTNVITIILKISDTGIGIGQKNLETIFEPFFQADGSATRQFEGTGLGLSIVKKLLTMMGGTIVAESQKGKRTVFTVRLNHVQAELDKKSSLSGEFKELLIVPQMAEPDSLMLESWPDALMHLFQVNSLPLIKRFQKAFSADEVESLGKELKRLAEKYEQEDLKKFSVSLITKAQAFDIEGIKHEFEKMIKLTDQL